MSSFDEAFIILASLSQCYDVFPDEYDTGYCWHVKELGIQLEKDGIVFSHGEFQNGVSFKVSYEDLLFKDYPLDELGKDLHIKIQPDYGIHIKLTPIDSSKELENDDTEYMTLDEIFDSMGMEQLPANCLLKEDIDTAKFEIAMNIRSLKRFIAETEY